jgi:hypothetical protein
MDKSELAKMPLTDGISHLRELLRKFSFGQNPVTSF